MFFQNPDGVLQFFVFFFREVEFDNVFYTVLAYLYRHGSEAVQNAVLDRKSVV